MFTATQKFRDAVALINNTDVQKIPLVLSRIVSNLHLSEQSFNESEQDQLKKVLKKSSLELKTLIDSCSFIFQQAAYYNSQAQHLLVQLESMGMDDGHRMAFAQVWDHYGVQYIRNLQEKPLGYPNSMNSVNWKLNLRMSQDDKNLMREPSAMMELGVEDAEKGNRLQIEFTKDELLKFFGKLEMVQEQLDGLQ